MDATYLHISQPISGWRRFLAKLPVHFAVIFVAFIWTFPTAGILVSSFREPNAIRDSGWWTVLSHPFNFTQYTLENYDRVTTAEGMGNAFLNSITVTVPATIIPVTIAAFAAYAFAWMDFRGRDVLFALVVGLLVVPLHMALIPLLRLYNSVDLGGTFLGIWLAHTGFGLPLAIYLLYSFISQLPRDLLEAAYIDGASHFTAFTQLVIPLSVPAIASFIVFQFLWVWNDLLVSLVFLGTKPDVVVVTARLSELTGSRGEEWHLLTAGAFISMLIPLIIFFALQRFFVRGLLAGSIKA